MFETPLWQEALWNRRRIGKARPRLKLGAFIHPKRPSCRNIIMLVENASEKFSRSFIDCVTTAHGETLAENASSHRISFLSGVLKIKRLLVENVSESQIL